MEPISNSKKWQTLLVLSMAEFLGMAVWFSASAVVPALTQTWGLDDGGRAWLTISVQVGFVVGSFGSAVLNLADRVPARKLFSGSAVFAGAFTISIPLFSNQVESAIIFRFLTGLALAGVYPVGMKIMATWTQKDRGLGIGLLVGALTLGSALPHLIHAFGGVTNWQPVLYIAAGLAFLGGLIGWVFVREGPYTSKSPPFNWRYVGNILREKDVVLVNVGYLGHMWELYAMWSWIPIFLLASFKLSGFSPAWASVWAFITIATGGLGSAIAGRYADRYGRARVTIVSMVISGACAIGIGWFYGSNPALVVLVSLIWGSTVVSDSAQFSAAVSELADRDYVGTALTLQTSLGFLLTVITIRLIPTFEALVGWRWAFTILAPGPIIGIWAMSKLRRSKGSLKLAGGKG